MSSILIYPPSYMTSGWLRSICFRASVRYVYTYDRGTWAYTVRNARITAGDMPLYNGCRDFTHPITKQAQAGTSATQDLRT